jgi:hypothetical protein
VASELACRMTAMAAASTNAKKIASRLSQVTPSHHHTLHIIAYHHTITHHYKSSRISRSITRYHTSNLSSLGSTPSHLTSPHLTSHHLITPLSHLIITLSSLHSSAGLQQSQTGNSHGRNPRDLCRRRCRFGLSKIPSII